MKQFVFLSLRFWLFCQAVALGLLLMLAVCGFSYILLAGTGLEIAAYLVCSAEFVLGIHAIYRLSKAYWLHYFENHELEGSVFSKSLLALLLAGCQLFAAACQQHGNSLAQISAGMYGWLLPLINVSFVGTTLLVGIPAMFVLWVFAAVYLFCLAMYCRFYILAYDSEVYYVRLGLAFLLLVGGYSNRIDQWQKESVVVTSHNFAYENGLSSTDLSRYRIYNEDNLLAKPEQESSLHLLKGQWPVLDGAEAAFPVYSAFANAVYADIGKETDDEIDEYVTFTNTVWAYERLLNREVDIFFGAMPSAEQRAMAEAEGVRLVLTPIGKEAFVFFVDGTNRIDDLSVTDIQNIYSGRVKNWAELGGGDQRILAFQRPKNSGSQTLLEHIMGDVPLAQPLRSEYVDSMSGIISRVAAYNNEAGALGFSFRFFFNEMTLKDLPDENIAPKLLKINGIAPDDEAVASGAYPFTTNLYAITLEDNNKPEVRVLLRWAQSAEGQSLVEKAGYVKVK